MTPEEVRKQLLGKFREVSGDRLEKIGLAVMALEKNAGDANAAEDIARELHTLKGEARMLGLPGVGTVAHAAEDLLKALRENRTTLDKASDLMLRACDVISVLVDDFEAAAQPQPSAASELLAQLTAQVMRRAAQEPAPRTPA